MHSSTTRRAGACVAGGDAIEVVGHPVEFVQPRPGKAPAGALLIGAVREREVASVEECTRSRDNGYTTGWAVNQRTAN